MRKKAVLLLILAVFAVFALTACTHYSDVSKGKHDDITDAGWQQYIAVDDGKFYLYGLNKTDPLACGFDKLEYVDDVSDKYLLGYNKSDYGCTLLDNTGNVLLSSDIDRKIAAVSLIYDVGLGAEGQTYYNTYGFDIDYFDENNVSCSGIFYLDGSLAHAGARCQIETRKTSNTIVYIFMTCYDSQGKVVLRKVIDKNLNTVIDLSFDKHTVFDTAQSFETSIGYVVYAKKTFDESGNELSSRRYYDIYCGKQSFAGYDNVTKISTFGNGNALFAKKDGNASLFNEVGIVAEFDAALNAKAENNNIKVTKQNGLLDIYKYDGTLLLTDVKQNNNFYSKQIDDIVYVYNYQGNELSSYDINEVKKAERKQFVNQFKLSEVIVYTSEQNDVWYQFFVDGVLKREYDTSYSLLSEDKNGTYVFCTEKNDIVDNYYYYNIFSGAEFVIKAQLDGTTNAKFGAILGYKYYTEKDSKDIIFYEKAVKKLTPYTGPYIPGYAQNSGYFAITRQPFGPNLHILCMEFDTYKVRKVFGNDVYTNLYERWYAYYVITDTGLAANILFVYSGLSKMTVEYNELHSLMCFSTIDRFADADLYKSFAKLDNRTIVYNVKQSADRATFSKVGEVRKSNMAVFDSKYLVGIDYKNQQRNFVYTIAGEEVLSTKYYIADIKGGLAVINFLGKEDKSAFGVYDLENKKVLEQCDNNFIRLLGGGYYAVEKLAKTGSEFTIKNTAGKKVVNKAVSIGFVCQRYDFDEGESWFYKINLGKNNVKLLKIYVPKT